MIVDLITMPQAYQGQLKCQVCIVGAGPAGISLALSLARLRPDWQILLLEAGGKENASDRERAIYQVDQTGSKDYTVLDISRRRKFGGTTAHWGGWSRPLDDTDFETNPDWEIPSWPISPQALGDYYPSACDWCELGGSSFNTQFVEQFSPGAMLQNGVLDGLENQLFRFSPPTRFGTRYEAELESQDNLLCLLHANLKELRRSGDKVVEAIVAPLDGSELRISADRFVLAMGGMETTRYLLHMRGSAKDDGQGIYSHHLGRYFADHIGFTVGQVLAPAGLQYHRFTAAEQRVMPVLAYSPELIRQEQHNNSCLRLYAVAADPTLPNSYAKHQSLAFAPGDFWQYEVKITAEPRPVYDSRLFLGTERCELGLPRLQLDWQIDERDFISAYSLVERLGVELGSTGFGRLKITRENSPELRDSVTGGCHHLGTARMAANPEDGVVDADLKVFDSANLYVASSAVFPRYGYSNPTLTIVALALRLADHLAGKEARV